MNSKTITQKSRSNLALAFFCLSKEQKQAMTVFYAFCRLVDDIVDEQEFGKEGSQQEIEAWRREIFACEHGTPHTVLGKELKEIIQRYSIPTQFFYDILDGVEMDLNHQRYATFADLERYCYRVASAVGLVSVRIFGCKDAEADRYAVALGMAFQLTNILRDVREDLRQHGRVYLPQEEMKSFGVTEEHLHQPHASPQLLKLFHMHYFRAVHYHNQAKSWITPQNREHLKASYIMTAVYRDILEKIKDNGFAVLSGKIKLNRWEKLRAVAKGMWILPAVAPCRPQEIAIFGAGFSGISSALHLAREGHRVRVYEGKSYVGGRAHSFKEVKTGEVIDNGQHIFMGCYHHCMRLFDWLNVRNKLKQAEGLQLAFYSPTKGRSQLKASHLPSPLHLLSALFSYEELRVVDRLSALWMGLRLRLGGKARRGETVEGWLKRLGQTPNMTRALWEPLCIAALNEPVATATAELFETVVRRALFSQKEDAVILTSAVGLSDLLMPEAELFLKGVGSEVHLSQAVKKLVIHNDQISHAEMVNGSTVKADIFVSALPWTALASALPQHSELASKARSIKTAPILGIHLWLDRPIVTDPIIGLLDSPVHWIFDRSQPSEGKYMVAVVVSAAYEWFKFPSKDIVKRVMDELHRLLPESKEANVLHHFVYKGLDATFMTVPATESFRVGVKTEWANLKLAGDWTQTGLPATLEGAVQSGWAVARQIKSARV